MMPIQPRAEASQAQASAPVQQAPLQVQRANPGTPVVTQSHQMDPVPAQPLAREKIPATAPRISYQNNELTVVAENSSLGEILSAIRAATGMKIEGPSGSADRVTAKIGPAPVRDVLLSLLEGSRYDFAMLGSATDPQIVERLLLSMRSAGGDSNYAAAPQPPQQTEPSDSAPSDDDDNPGIAPPSATTPAQPVKTPEQLLEDLRKLEADRAQQQQKNNPTPGDPNAPRISRPERPK
jgi:hypothetical protein